MFLRVASLLAAAMATAIGSTSPANAQSPIAAAISAPTSPVISADDQCGDGWEWSKSGWPLHTRTDSGTDGTARGDLSMCRWGLLL